MKWKVGDTFKSLITSQIYKILYIDDTHVVVGFKNNSGNPDKSLWRVASLSNTTRFERYDPDEIKIGDEFIGMYTGGLYKVLYIGKENVVIIMVGYPEGIFIPLAKLRDQKTYKKVS